MCALKTDIPESSTSLAECVPHMSHTKSSYPSASLASSESKSSWMRMQLGCMILRGVPRYILHKVLGIKNLMFPSLNSALRSLDCRMCLNLMPPSGIASSVRRPSSLGSTESTCNHRVFQPGPCSQCEVPNNLLELHTRVLGLA